MSAISRKLYGDSLKAPKELKPELTDQLNHMILQGMALEAKDRSSSIAVWIRLLDVPTQLFLQEKISNVATKSSSKKKESTSSRKQKQLNNSSPLPINIGRYVRLMAKSR